MSKVKPILFNTEMVRAILDGRKTVTRRICKDGNAYTVPDMSFYDADRRTYAVHNYANLKHTEKLSLAERTCPICPGDILYVRETWLKVTDVKIERLQDINYFGCLAEGIPYKQYEKDIIKDFSESWDSTIKKSDIDRYGWEANPWVWVIAFERCEKPESEKKYGNEN